jgi:formylglycine-generating enzyme required for sulfatase activity
MVEVPAGAFVMGESNADASERPPHRVEIKRAFALGQTEVTVAQWRVCVDGGGCPPISEMQNANEAIPMHNVDWGDAQAYVKWLSGKTGKPYRLPSEAEWEYAARGGTSFRYWWGQEMAPVRASCKDCGGAAGKSSPPSVGSFPANPFGLFDMNGGVSEWVADCWNATYDGAPTDGSARTKGNCSRRVLRGGSWLDEHKYITATCRVFYDYDVRYPANGFRVALDLN